MKKYDLKYNDCTVGTVQVEKCGLYYRIYSRFVLQNIGALRLWVFCGDTELDLGLCVQYHEQQGTERCLPINRIGEGQLHFYLKADDLFIPVEDTQPFGHLAELTNGRFATRSGVKGIIFRDCTA